MNDTYVSTRLTSIESKLVGNSNEVGIKNFSLFILSYKL